MEADEHDGEDDPTVLVDITASHSEYSVWRLGGRQTGQGQLDRLAGLLDRATAPAAAPSSLKLHVGLQLMGKWRLRTREGLAPDLFPNFALNRRQSGKCLY